MSKILSLFEQHLIDLQRISPKAGDVFVCPLCFNIFDRDKVVNEVGSEGHIWPSFIRSQIDSDSVKDHQVLLCRRCNSSAGNRGDNEMQVHEKTRRGFLPSKMWIYSPREKPVAFNLFVTPPEDNSPDKMDIKLRVPSGEWIYSKKWKKFRELAENKQQFTAALVKFPTDWKLAQVGWLTSAYLFAFYTFGYKYVFQSRLDPVREYIKQSFDGDATSALYVEPEKDTSVQTCSKHNFQEPKIVYHMQTQGSVTPPHLEISLLNYHVRLPIPLKFPLIVPSDLLPDPQMVIAGDATGHTPHDGECSWEEMLLEPDYEVIGSRIAKCSTD